MSITPAQSRAARGLINWSQEQLAERSNVARNTIARFENGATVPGENNMAAIRAALEKAGVIFVDENGAEPGVRLRRLRVVSEIDRMSVLVERLRLTAIGDPVWNTKDGVYEFREESAKVVAVLKLIRAAQGVRALDALMRAGLFIDFGAIMRCVNDAISEIYFLLEEFPKSSANVDQFVKAFFASNIREYLSDETPPVQTKKIRSAYVRHLKDRHDHVTQDLLDRIFRTFSGYIHANYAHIMEMFGGPSRSFNMDGIPSSVERAKRVEFVQLAANSVLSAAHVISHKLGLNDLKREIFEVIEKSS